MRSKRVRVRSALARPTHGQLTRRHSAVSENTQQNLMQSGAGHTVRLACDVVTSAVRSRPVSLARPGREAYAHVNGTSVRIHRPAILCFECRTWLHPLCRANNVLGMGRCWHPPHPELCVISNRQFVFVGNAVYRRIPVDIQGVMSSDGPRDSKTYSWKQASDNLKGDSDHKYPLLQYAGCRNTALPLLSRQITSPSICSTYQNPLRDDLTLLHSTTC